MSKTIFPILITALSVLLTDQISKLIVLKKATEWVVLNQQGTWGIIPVKLSIVALVILAYWLGRQKNKSLILWAILAAGLSNMLDRIIYNGVIDWIHTFSWFPIFNLADMVISGGVVILLMKEIVSHDKS